MQTIVFGGGCFWCTDAVFRQLRGIISVTVGYSGGDKPQPTYDEVCSGSTGHAEAVQIEYDETAISLGDLLTVFFATHDPTSLNRQGADVGTQYRSAIFYTTPEQKSASEKLIAEINASPGAGDKVVTEVAPLDKFWPAEEYHRDYFAKNSGNNYCTIVINPKLDKVKRKFSQLLKSQS